MGNEWKTGILADIADVIMGQSPPGASCSKIQIGMPLLNGPTEFGESYPFPVQFTSEPKKKSICGDILFCVRGSTTGRMNLSDQEYAIGRGIAAIRHKKGIEYQPFLKGVIEFLLPSILSQTTGSTFPNISRDDLSNIIIQIPPLPIQKRIAHILGSLDDKIELNRQMNQTLEAMAKTIFKSWFVDFDPIKAKAEGKPTGLPPHIEQLFPDSFEESELGLIPKGWRVESIVKVANFINGLACQKYPPQDDERGLPVIKIREMRQGINETSDRATRNVPSEYIVKDGDVLFSWSGSLVVDFWSNGKGVLNQHVFKVTSNVEEKWFYYLWLQEHLLAFKSIAADKATTMGHINRNHLEDAKVLMPDKQLLVWMNTQIESLVEHVITNLIEIKELSRLRDTLLPKLLCGEIEV